MTTRRHDLALDGDTVAVTSNHHAAYWITLVLLLFFWTRLHALTSLPLHNDEGLHLTRAVEVWNLHPFWDISDGKIINHWLIAAFYPLNAAPFVGRIATVFTALIGLSAGIALLRRQFGLFPAFMGAALWLFTPPQFFYERLALSDAQAGAFGVAALWAAMCLARTGKRGDAILTGVWLTLAALFKFTAAPFALSVALIVLLAGSQPRRRRLLNLLTIGVVGIAGVAIPLLYSFLRADGFGIAFGWISGSGGSSGLADSLGRFGLFIFEFGGYAWWLLVFAGLLPFFARRDSLILWLAGLLPLLTVLLLGRDIMPRHFTTGLPILLLLAGAGLARLLRWIARHEPARLFTRFATVLIFVWLVYDALSYFDTAYTAPDELSLPPLDSGQFITDHSSGYGLREAAQRFAVTASEDGAPAPILGSMFPDSCRRANFYADSSHQMVCTDAPGVLRLRELLAQYGIAFVLVEAPPIGMDVQQTFGARATLIASYPRPGEVEADAAVKLWRVEMPHGVSSESGD